MVLNNSVYDVLKYIAQIVIPAIGVLWFTIAQIWNIPYGQEILGTITAVDCFLGAILGISTAVYNKKLEGK